MGQETFHLPVGSEFGDLVLFEQVRDRITSDSEDNTLVAGGGKSGEKRGEGTRCRVGVAVNSPNQTQLFPPGAWSSLGKLDTGMSAST